MQHIVLNINKTLTYIRSIILAIFKENSNKYGCFGKTIQFFFIF